MEKEIKITKKAARRGDDGYKVVSVRMKEEMIERLDELSTRTNRSRNELINLLLDAAMEIVKVEEQQQGQLFAVPVAISDITVLTRVPRDFSAVGKTVKKSPRQKLQTLIPKTIPRRRVVFSVPLRLGLPRLAGYPLA